MSYQPYAWWPVAYHVHVCLCLRLSGSFGCLCVSVCLTCVWVSVSVGRWVRLFIYLMHLHAKLNPFASQTHNQDFLPLDPGVHCAKWSNSLCTGHVGFCLGLSIACAMQGWHIWDQSTS